MTKAHKKRAISLISLLLILCSLLAVPAGAVLEDPVEPVDPIDPVDPYVDIEATYVLCQVYSNGLTDCYSWIRTANSSYTIYLYMSLQRYNSSNGSWTNVKSWSTSAAHNVWMEKYRYVSSGYYYRVAATATVYTSSGGYVESVTVYSPSSYY